MAGLLNKAFINVKVDREERPDLDNYYMTVCQAISGEGGWPLTIVMTPEKEPFFASTHLPRESRFGRIGMMDLIPAVEGIWSEQRQEITDTAAQVASRLTRSLVLTPGRALDESVLDHAYQQLLERFDSRHGGFGDAPKFPTPHNLSFLLRYWKRSGDREALVMAEKTLKAISLGGIHDHIGFGFHRYSTDEKWFAPHFEKMLYDQAMLAIAYTEAYQATGRAEYEEAARHTFEYVLRAMRSSEGGFYSAEDAESEGKEGAFYLWTTAEIEEALSHDEAELFIKMFNVEEQGNFPDEVTGRTTGRNILFLKKPVPQIASALNMPEQELRKRIDAARKCLLEARECRAHPGKDDKILADWNGLMIAALAKGAQAFSSTDYGRAARSAADFVIGKMRGLRGRILHRYRDGEAASIRKLYDLPRLLKTRPE